MKRIVACMLALLLVLVAPMCALADDLANEPVIHVDSPAPAPAAPTAPEKAPEKAPEPAPEKAQDIAPDPAPAPAPAPASDPGPGPALGASGDAGLIVAQADAANPVEATGGAPNGATIDAPAAEETGAEVADESGTEAPAAKAIAPKAAESVLTVSITTLSPSLIRPLRDALQLTVTATCGVSAPVDLIVELGKDGTQYPLSGNTNTALTLSIPAADVNALAVGEVGVFVSYVGDAQVLPLASVKALTLTLSDNQYSLLGEKLSLHHERTSGTPLSFDVPLQALVAVPEMIPAGTLTIGSATFQSALPGAPNTLHFDIPAEQMDGMVPGGYDMLISIPESKPDNLRELKNLSIGTIVITDPRQVPVYVGSKASIMVKRGSSDDVDFKVKFSSGNVESAPVDYELTKGKKSFDVELYGFVLLDGEASELTLDGADLKKLDAGIYTLSISTQATQYNQPSHTVKRELIVGTVPEISTKKLPEGAIGEAYRATIKTTGSPKPTLKIVSGKLPKGLLMSGSGAITGTPTSSGTFKFRVAADSRFDADVERAFTIVITGEDDGIEDIEDSDTPLSAGNWLPTLPKDYKPTGDAAEGVATLCGLETPLLASLVRQQDVDAAELLKLMQRSTASGTPLNTAKLPFEGLRLPLICSGRYVGYALFIPARDSDGKDAVRFEVSLIPGTSIGTVGVDGERVPDVRLRMMPSGAASADDQEPFYVEPGDMLPASGLELVELSVGVSYHPDSSPEYAPRRVSTDQIGQLVK